jgi:hypothetical protein
MLRGLAAVMALAAVGSSAPSRFHIESITEDGYDDAADAADVTTVRVRLSC